jgi:hypothetical protein
MYENGGKKKKKKKDCSIYVEEVRMRRKKTLKNLNRNASA